MEMNQFQSEISLGQLVNHDNVRKMISDDQIFTSFKNIMVTPQYFHNVLLDVLGSLQFGLYTFFLTCSTSEFLWTEIICLVTYQYGQILTDEQGNATELECKGKLLKVKSSYCSKAK